jgi:hypothetical protein
MHQFTFTNLQTSFRTTWVKNSDRRGGEEADRNFKRNENENFVQFFRRVIAIQPLDYLLSYGMILLIHVNPVTVMYSKKELKNIFLDKLDSNFKCECLLCTHRQMKIV